MNYFNLNEEEKKLIENHRKVWEIDLSNVDTISYRIFKKIKDGAVNDFKILDSKYLNGGHEKRNTHYLVRQTKCDGTNVFIKHFIQSIK